MIVARTADPRGLDYGVDPWRSQGPGLLWIIARNSQNKARSVMITPSAFRKEVKLYTVYAMFYNLAFRIGAEES
jgi:hypothetical protein